MSTKGRIISTLLITVIFGGIAYLSAKHHCEPVFTVSVVVGIWILTVIWNLQPRLPDTCQRCYRITDPNELISNSKYGSYMFDEICDSCANKYDKMNDEHKQERA